MRCRGHSVRWPNPADPSDARQNLKIQNMKDIKRIIRWSCLTAVIGLVCAVSFGKQPGRDTKPFKETGLEYFVTQVISGSFQHQFFQDARDQWGTEVWAGVILQTFQNNVGGQGSSLAMEAVFLDETGATLVYAMKYEVVADGDQLAMAGSFRPQADGSIVGLSFAQFQPQVVMMVQEDETMQPDAKTIDPLGEDLQETPPVAGIPVNGFPFMAAGTHVIPTARFLHP